MASTDTKTSPGVVSRLVRTLSNKNKRPPSSGGLTSPLPATAELEEKQEVRIIASPTPKSRWPTIERLKNFGKLGKQKPSQPLAADGDDDSPAPTSPTVENNGIHQLAAITEDSGDKQEPPDPTGLAQRIQALIDSLPTPTAGVPQATPKPHPPARGRDGRPIPPPGSSPIDDPLLLMLLQDASVMNGSPDEGRPSVWSILDDIGALTHAESGEGDDGGDENSYSGDFSLMVYVPLVPTKNSKVEVARSVMVNVESPAKVALWKNIWPWNPKKDKPDVPPAPPQAPAEGEDDQQEAGQGRGRKATIVRRLWVPSTTQISVQAMWWGYRIYLPPPVLAVLDSKEREAVKIASIVTTALRWLFSNIPIAIIPPPLQPTVLLLQRIVPYLGYIGSLVAWSWSTIKAYNKGNGVVLTATWLLPVALLPSAMDPPGAPQIQTQPARAPTPATAASAPNFPTVPGPPSAPGSPVTAPGRVSVDVTVEGKFSPDKGAVPAPLDADGPVIDAKAKVKGKGRFWKLGSATS